jgi:hypothetical protein
MTQGVNGHFDIAGDYGFTGRFFYAETYDEKTGNRTVSITGISIQSKTYGSTWYPGGPVAVDGETLFAMDYNDPATNWVTIGEAGDQWYKVGGRTVAAFPWASEELKSNPDGSKNVTFTVDLTLYRNSSSPKPTISGNFTVELTKLNFGPTPWLRWKGEWVNPVPVLRRNGSWVNPTPNIK